MSAFDEADLYDWRKDAEQLHCATPEEAIEDCLRDCDDVAAEIAKVCPLTIRAFARGAVTERWLTSTADWLAEALSEHWDDEYGGDDPLMDVEAAAELLLPALRTIAAATEVWRCDQVATREYSAAEVEALMREMNPDWFEAKP